MTSETSKILPDTLRRLLHRNATTSLHNIVNKTHPADLARTFHSLSQAQQLTLFDLIEDREKQGNLLKKLDKDDLAAIVESMNLDALISILEQLPQDDVTDLVGRLPEETGQQILAGMDRLNSAEIVELHVAGNLSGLYLAAAVFASSYRSGRCHGPFRDDRH